MALTTRAKIIALDAIARAVAPAASVDRVGVFVQQAGKAVTGTGDTFTSNAHGYANGDVVGFSAVTGGGGTIVVNRPYFVRDVTANTFKLAHVEGGAALALAADVTAVSTIHRYVEPGAPYARVAIAWNAAVAPGTIDDSTNGAVVNVPAANDVDAEGGWHNASGNLLVFNKVNKVAGDAANWTYTITDADLAIND